MLRTQKPNCIESKKEKKKKQISEMKTYQNTINAEGERNTTWKKEEMLQTETKWKKEEKERRGVEKEGEKETADQ